MIHGEIILINAKRVLSHDEGLFAGSLELLSVSERQRLSDINGEKRRREFLLGRYFLRKILSEYFNQPLGFWRIEERPDNKPQVVNLPEGYEFSISHSRNIFALSLAKLQHGLDIEDISKKRDFLALSKLWFNEQEQELLHHNNPLIRNAFYRIWCAKEAWYKALDYRQQQKTNPMMLNYSTLRTNTLWHLWEGTQQGCQCSIVAKGEIEKVVATHCGGKPHTFL